MGHLHLGNLPRTHRWKQVIGLLEDGAGLSDLAKASFQAALTGLHQVTSDGGFFATIYAIVELAAASRERDIVSALAKFGVDPADQTSSFGLVSSISQKISDQLNQVYPRSDVGKIAQNAFLESLSHQVTVKTGSLFDEGGEDIRTLTAPFRGKQFKVLMHEFYSVFTSRYLLYHLSRELPNHVGEGRRFKNLEQQAVFARDFDLYCRQTVRIADEFTPGWVGKAVYDRDTGPSAVRRYANVAFKKIASEFQKDGD